MRYLSILPYLLFQLSTGCKPKNDENFSAPQAAQTEPSIESPNSESPTVYIIQNQALQLVVARKVGGSAVADSASDSAAAPAVSAPLAQPGLPAIRRVMLRPDISRDLSASSLSQSLAPSDLAFDLRAIPLAEAPGRHSKISLPERLKIDFGGEAEGAAGESSIDAGRTLVAPKTIDDIDKIALKKGPAYLLLPNHPALRDMTRSVFRIGGLGLEFKRPTGVVYADDDTHVILEAAVPEAIVSGRARYAESNVSWDFRRSKDRTVAAKSQVEKLKETVKIVRGGDITGAEISVEPDDPGGVPGRYGLGYNQATGEISVGAAFKNHSSLPPGIAQEALFRAIAEQLPGKSMKISVLKHSFVVNEDTIEAIKIDAGEFSGQVQLQGKLEDLAVLRAPNGRNILDALVASDDTLGSTGAVLEKIDRVFVRNLGGRHQEAYDVFILLKEPLEIK